MTRLRLSRCQDSLERLVPPLHPVEGQGPLRRPAHPGDVVPVGALGLRRRRLSHRLGGLLHPNRRPLRRTGRPRSHDRGRSNLLVRRPPGPTRGSSGHPVQLDRRCRPPGAAVRCLGAGGQLRRVRRRRGAPRTRLLLAAVGSRRLPDLGLPCGDPGARVRLHARRPQRRLHARRPGQRSRPGRRLQHADQGRTGDDRRGAAGQRLLDLAPSPPRHRCLARRPEAGRTRPPRRPAQPRVPRDDLLRRRARHPSSPAQRRHPAVAGPGDRRPAGAAGVALRHEHRHGRRAAR